MKNLYSNIIMVKRMRKRIRKGKGAVSGRRFKRGVNKGLLMVNRTPSKMHEVVAPKFRTHLEYGFTGYQATTAAGLGAGPTNFSVLMNGLTFPGSVVNSTFTDAAHFQGTLFPATLALTALNPLGHAQLSVLYQSYRVLSSKFQITYTPYSFQAATASGLVDIVVAPMNDAIPVDMQKALSLPWSKYKQVSFTNNLKNNTLTLYHKCHEILGRTKNQYYTDVGTFAAVSVNPTGADLLQWNVLCLPSGSVSQTGGTGASIAPTYYGGNIDVKVTYEVEYFDPLLPTDV